MNSNNQRNNQPQPLEAYRHGQPTVKQLKSICECYSLNRRIRKNATRQEMLTILDEVSVHSNTSFS